MNSIPEVVIVVFISACLVLMAAHGLYRIIKYTRYWLRSWLQERRCSREWRDWSSQEKEYQRKLWDNWSRSCP